MNLLIEDDGESREVFIGRKQVIAQTDYATNAGPKPAGKNTPRIVNAAEKFVPVGDDSKAKDF